MLALILIGIGIILRVAPHSSNFTPTAAIALFAGAYLGRKESLIVPLLLMAISDMIIGMHNVAIFTWAGFILAAFLGRRLKERKTAGAVCTMSLASSLIFYVVSNFGVWAMGWYPRTFQGLVSCYVMALPFLRDFTLATVLYAFAFFGAYEAIANRIKDTKLAAALLRK